jgi:hypothetical protein
VTHDCLTTGEVIRPCPACGEATCIECERTHRALCHGGECRCHECVEDRAAGYADAKEE